MCRSRRWPSWAKATLVCQNRPTRTAALCMRARNQVVKCEVTDTGSNPTMVGCPEWPGHNNWLFHEKVFLIISELFFLWHVFLNFLLDNVLKPFVSSESSHFSPTGKCIETEAAYRWCIFLIKYFHHVIVFTNDFCNFVWIWMLDYIFFYITASTHAQSKHIELRSVDVWSFDPLSIDLSALFAERVCWYLQPSLGIRLRSTIQASSTSVVRETFCHFLSLFVELWIFRLIFQFVEIILPGILRELYWHLEPNSIDTSAAPFRASHPRLSFRNQSLDQSFRLSSQWLRSRCINKDAVKRALIWVNWQFVIWWHAMLWCAFFVSLLVVLNAPLESTVRSSVFRSTL